MKIILAAALLLCCPAASLAAPVVPPVGDAAGGYTLEATDTWSQIGLRGSNTSLPFDVTNGVVRTPYNVLQWGSAGCSAVNLPGAPQIGGACTLVPGQIATWRAQRFHRYRKTQPYLDVTLARFYAADGPGVLVFGTDVATVRPELDTPDCNMTGDNPGWVVPWGPGPAGLGAGPDAPDDFAAACGLPRPTSSDPTENPPTIPTTNPTAAATCAPITYSRRRVKVTARSASCTSARTIMVRYLTRGIEPRGWVCVQTRLGRSRAASCGRPGRSASGPRIAATWRA